MLKIVIHAPNSDFTPKGKRTARIVKTAMNGRKMRQVIRCYVGGKAYMQKELSDYALVNEWLGV